jgi:glycogen(starch) synthase
MQVLHVSPRYYPFIGGSEIYCQEMSERLVQDGHQVTVLTTDAWDVEYFGDPRKKHMPCGTFNYHGVQVQRFAVRNLFSSWLGFAVVRRTIVSLAGLPFDTRPLLFGLSRWHPWVPGLWRALDRATLAESYDLVHVMNMPFDSMVYAAYRFAKRKRIPLVTTPFLHLGESHDDSVRRYYTMPHQMTMLRDSDCVIVQTDLERDYLLGQGVTEQRIRKVGVGINPESLLGGNGERFRQRHSLRAPIVFCIGPQAYDKGTTHLVQAMAQLWEQGMDASLVLAGPTTGDFERYLRTLPDCVRERCRLLGFVSEDDKRDLLAAGDVFAMPSRTESYGIVYLEAWLYNKPVVGAHAGAVPEVIHDGQDGLLVPFGDVPRLANAIRSLLEDREQARRLGEAGYQKTIAEHTWDQKYAVLEAAYEELALESGARGGKRGTG